jgi:hypothetical protein
LARDAESLNIQAEAGKPKRFPLLVPASVLRDIGTPEGKLHPFEIILCAAGWERRQSLPLHFAILMIYG